MRRTVIAAGVLTALVFGTVGYAWAADLGSGEVAVSATVNPKFEMTVNDATVAFGALDPGTSTTLGTSITVKSNQLWNLTESATECDLDAYLTDDVAPANYGRGVQDIAINYTLDLTSDTAWEITPSDYSKTYTYTAVQGNL